MKHLSTEFVEHYLAHHDFVWRSLQALGVPTAGVEDAVQEVFVVLHRRLPHFDHAAPVRAWLYGIARRVAMQVRRKQSRTVELKPQADPRALDPETDLDRAQRMAMVQDFLDGLDEGRREVFVMTEIEGMTAPEVSTALGVKLNTVYSRLRTARQKFQSAVKQAQRRHAQPRRVRHA